MKRGIVTVLLVLTALMAAAAQDGVAVEPLWMPTPSPSPRSDAAAAARQVDPTPTRAFVFGPRVGAGYSFVSTEEFTQSIASTAIGLNPGTIVYPVYSLFGLNAEYRILLGQTRDHFAIQTLGFLFGIEQSLAIPAGALMMGYRHHQGFEFGVGPVYNPGGLGVLLALGWTFTAGGVYIPVDLAYQIPNSRMAGAISLSTGFNFTYDSSPSRTSSSRW